MSESFNPLARGKSRQSTEAAPPAAEAHKFDTTTPVQVTVRRFTLNDLPRYADAMYPVLQDIFPHLHKNMYGGWLRSCMDDNATFFVCGNATVALAKMDHDPLDPRPVVKIVFCIGDPAEYEGMGKEILRWAKDIGAREARFETGNGHEIGKVFKHTKMEVRKIAVFHLD